jgi:hypothetical protein
MRKVNRNRRNICLQADSCKNGICSGSPLKCQNQWIMNTISSSIATGLSTTTALVGSTKSKI